MAAAAEAAGFDGPIPPGGPGDFGPGGPQGPGVQEEILVQEDQEDRVIQVDRVVQGGDFGPGEPGAGKSGPVHLADLDLLETQVRYICKPGGDFGSPFGGPGGPLGGPGGIGVSILVLVPGGLTLLHSVALFAVLGLLTLLVAQEALAQTHLVVQEVLALIHLVVQEVLALIHLVVLLIQLWEAVIIWVLQTH